MSRVERKEIPIYKNSHDLSNVPKPGDTVACSWEREKFLHHHHHHHHHHHSSRLV
jgi:hypothetical protein